jgi:hypothetical protein
MFTGKSSKTSLLNRRGRNHDLHAFLVRHQADREAVKTLVELVNVSQPAAVLLCAARTIVDLPLLVRGIAVVPATQATKPAARHSKGRIVLTAIPSLGDLYPYIVIGLGLKELGHQAVIATSACYRQKIEALGLGFRAVSPSPARQSSAPTATPASDPARGSSAALPSPEWTARRRTGSPAAR